MAQRGAGSRGGDVGMSQKGPRPLWALLPVKDFARAKSRLAPVLPTSARAALAQRMCEQVLHTLGQCAEIDGILILGGSQRVQQVAERYGARFEHEKDCGLPLPLSASQLGAIVDHGLMRLQLGGARAALVLMSDLPRLQPHELSQLLALLAEHDCVIAPDLREQNTNALALRLAPATATAFGSGDSFRLHLERAAAAGQRTAVYRSPGLGFDVDLPSDYRELPLALAKST
jgi:2-phospho-L-lactate guanylyltransferase